MHEAYNSAAVIPVKEFAPGAGDTYATLQYPFLRPDSSFFTDGENVTILPDTLDSFWEEANATLAEKGVPLLEERVPVIGYGSNVSPSRLRQKLEAYGPHDFADELQAVPMLKVTVPDAMTVWHGTPSSTGSAFAELYDGNEAKGTKTEAFIQFLTKEQLGLIHKTEGATYHFVQLQTTSLDDKPLQAFAYVAGDSSILLKDGRPIPMKLPNQVDGEGMTAREAVAYMLDNAGDEIGVTNPEALVDQYGATGVEGRRKMREQMAPRLKKLGLSADFSFKADIFTGRADFNTVTTNGHATDALQMPEQVLSRLRPNKDEYLALVAEFESKGVDHTEAMRKADVRLDVMRAIRRLATTEIEQRINNSEK